MRFRQTRHAAVAGNLKRQDASAIVADSRGDPAGRALFHQEDDAASAARAAGFGGPSAMPGGDADQFVDQRSGNSGSVGAAQLPFLAKQAGHLIPLGIGKGLVHGARNFDDALEVTEHSFVAVDVCLENLPIVDAGLARRTGVGQHKAGFDLFRRNRDRLAVDPVGIKMNRAGALRKERDSNPGSRWARWMIWASTFCAITRICSSVRLRSVKRARAAVLAIIRADDPEMPAPAGDSESVSISRPSLGAKNCSSLAAKGRRKRFAARSASKLENSSSRRVSIERK